MSNETASRKDQHLDIAKLDSVERQNDMWSRVQLPHCALPELNYDAIDTTTHFLNKKLSLPLMVGAMTGGTERAHTINRQLAAMCQHHQLALGLGSQRVMLEHPDTTATFAVRDVAPDIAIVANIGAVQLNYGVDYDDVAFLVDAVKADALVFHLNPAQEAVQPEGDTNFLGLVDKLQRLIELLPFPVGIKEVGHGLGRRDLHFIRSLKPAFIECSGNGGTSWTQIESYRVPSEAQCDSQVAQLFADWGVDTVTSLTMATELCPDTPLIASGGIRNGLHAAKAIALGANHVAMARPFLLACENNTLDTLVEYFRKSLKTSMFLSGCKDISALRKVGSYGDSYNDAAQ